MEQYRENYTHQLEHLLAIVNDGKEGYRKAAEKVHSSELKDQLFRYSEERVKMAEEFKEKLSKMGGKTGNTEGDNAGAIHRALMAFKTAFTREAKDDQAVLETCRTGDQAALDSFDEILQGSILETDLKPFLIHQRYIVSKAFYDIDKLYFERFKTGPEVE
jgi:uncharacterized protein (TIGR02284 family)